MTVTIPEFDPLLLLLILAILACYVGSALIMRRQDWDHLYAGDFTKLKMFVWLISPVFLVFWGLDRLLNPK